VLLFPNKRLSVAVSPTAVAGIAYAGRWHPQPIDHQAFYFEDNGIANTLAGLAEAFKSWTTPGSIVRIAISNRYMRSALMPWDGGRLGKQESIILAQQRFREYYGEMDDWTIRVDRDRGYGKEAIACAIPTVLLSEIERLCGEYKLICDGVIPSAIASLNRHIRINIPGALLYGVLEAEQLWLLAVQDTGRSYSPSSIRMLTIPVEPIPFTSLQATLERELLLQGLPPDTRVVLDGFGQLPEGRLGRIDVASSKYLNSVATEMAWISGWV
jgi:hypothetical protein